MTDKIAKAICEILDDQSQQIGRLKRALESAEAREAELHATVANLQAAAIQRNVYHDELRAEVERLRGMVPKPHHVKLLRNALDFFRTSAIPGPNDPYLHLTFFESLDFVDEWLATLPEAPHD